jgi:glycosyltransferase involved in cell wall biosynthesis
MADFSGFKVAVVVPAYRVEQQIESVVRGIPDFVGSIIVVDDASPDRTAEVVQSLGDDRVTLLRHSKNTGVGGAMKTGFAEALRQKVDIIVKMDGDDQMDPTHLPRLLGPLVSGKADMTKGNRYHDLHGLREMPIARIIGNAALTFMVKLSSGYWDMFDPTNGYLAIRSEVLERLRLGGLSRGYFFESGFLINLGIAGAVVRDVPISARYGREQSSLNIWKAVFDFPPRLLWGLIRRLIWRYIVFDFTAVSVFLLVGVPTFAWGVWKGMKAWYQMLETGKETTAGTVMLAAMPIILGFQLILQAIVIDVGNVPKVPLSLSRDSLPPEDPARGDDAGD